MFCLHLQVCAEAWATLASDYGTVAACVADLASQVQAKLRERCWAAAEQEFEDECGALVESEEAKAPGQFVELQHGPHSLRAHLDRLPGMRSWAMLQAALRPQFREACAGAGVDQSSFTVHGTVHGTVGACVSDLALQVRSVLGERCRVALEASATLSGAENRFLDECGALLAGHADDGQDVELRLGPYLVYFSLGGLPDQRSWAGLQGHLRSQFVEVCAEAWGQLDGRYDSVRACVADLAVQARAIIGGRCRGAKALAAAAADHDDGFVSECGALAEFGDGEGVRQDVELRLGGYLVYAPLAGLRAMRSWVMLQATLRPQFSEICAEAWASLGGAYASVGTCTLDLAAQVRAAIEARCRAFQAAGPPASSNGGVGEENFEV